MLRTAMAACALTLFACCPLVAQDGRSVDIHGFGGWSFGDTDVNRFLGAEPNGEYSKTTFAAKLTGTTSAAVQVNAQLFFRNGFDGSQVSLDYAFADWQLHNAVHLRVGKVKHPFGIYNEVAGLGTVRPFLNLPQSVYGPIALISKSYRGLGVRGSVAVRGGWSVEYDVYGGGIEYEQEESALDLLALPLVDSTLGGSLFESEAVIGARLVVQTPFDGLRLGGSAYSGRLDLPLAPTSTRFRTVGVSAEYVVDRTWVRAEYVHQRDRLAALQDCESAYYVEVAQFLGDHWQVAGEWGGIDIDVQLPPEFVGLDDLLRHRDRALGLNYWVSPQFGFKASVHWVEGNLMAELSPPDLEQLAFTRSSPHPKTRLMQFGAQFSF